MANTGVDGELMQQGLDMAVARNGGKVNLRFRCNKNLPELTIAPGKELLPHPKVSLQEGCAGAILAALDPSMRSR